MIEFPPVIAGDDIQVSATTYVTFLQCPDQAAGRLRGVYGPDSRPSFLGGLSHRVFARHLRDGPIAPDDFAQACREEIGTAMNPKMTSLGLRSGDLQGIIEEAGSLYERFKSLSFDGFAAAEVLIEVTPADGVELRGGIDAVFEDSDGGWRLVDWKTGAVGDAVLDQLEFYALLWALEHGQLPDEVEAISVATGQRTGLEPTSESVEETAGRVALLIDVLRSAWARGSDLDRTAGPWCRFCPLLEGCSEGRAALRLLAAP